MKTRELKLIAAGLALSGFTFFVGGIAGTASARTGVETVTVTETKTVEVPVEVTVAPPVETVLEVVKLPDSCLRAMELTSRVYDVVSVVSRGAGDQREIASFARVAMTGSDFLDLGTVIMMQDDLDATMSAGYTDLAAYTTELSTAIATCEADAPQGA